MPRHFRAPTRRPAPRGGVQAHPVHRATRFRSAPSAQRERRLRVTPTNHNASEPANQSASEHTLYHVDGANNNAKNTAYEIVYETAIVVEFGVSDDTLACNADPARGRCAWASLMGATVQRSTPGLTGGVVLRSVQVRDGSE